MNTKELVSIDFFDACAAGIYLLFGVVHLDLWLKRRDRTSHLWLAGAAGGALMVDLTGMRLRGAGDVTGFLPVLNVLGVVIVTVSLFELVLSFGNQSSSRFTRGVYLLLAVLALLLGSGWLPQAAPLFFFISLALLLWALVHAARAGHGGDRESRVIAIGLIVLVVCLVIDLLKELGIAPAVPGIPIIGFTVLFLLSASSLNSRYEREHRELATLRSDLEKRVQDRTRELEEANQRLAETSRTDSLTGLPNRRGFLAMSEPALQRSTGSGESASIIMIDLDRFKEVNDRHGHAGGDALLQAAASLLRSVVREEDLVARWGGEEFIVLVLNAAGDDSVSVAEKIRAALAAHRFEWNGVVESITASFGIAEHRPERSLEATIAAADDALYRAKEAGRNRVMPEK